MSQSTHIPAIHVQDHLYPAHSMRAALPGHAARQIITLVEYADYQCPFCQRAAEMLPRLLRKFGDQLRFVFRHYPLRDSHPLAQKAAESAEAAGAQGKFWEMHHLLFKRQGELSEEEDLIALADELELDVRKFKQELQDGTYERRVARDVAGADRGGVERTPTFFLNGNLFEDQWSYESLARRISDLQEKAVQAA